MTQGSLNGNSNGQKEVRKLRSKEAPKVNTSLFNYEENPESIDGDAQIKISHDNLEECEVLKTDFTIEKSSVSFVTDLKLIDDDLDDQNNGNGGGTKKKRKLRKSTTSTTRTLKPDPLIDELYHPYNKRMEKEEKKMINWEREKIYSEADKMKSQLEKLQQNNWSRILPTITYIRDPRDQVELEQKKQWTIESLTLLLERFEHWKKLEDKVLGRIRASSPVYKNDQFRFYSSTVDKELLEESDTDEEEDNKTLEEIKTHRMRKKIRKYGPIIKLKFDDKVIIAEPFKSTRIEKQ
ncbi:Something about silencing protein 4 [Wickerhamomyces ciferrii]|uniref:Something about silencing protein 4 n=1 Tax=Wickerhamomyces ciferrii (strain ATCC 14091 / BCRC 22168 / CBS 111 / JCM 3599 / NBRC 0793 / NRRL Y-1031 F-60-10) TaxID=1206466 RepID=K0KWZ0_WICCF|nr:Something about silencing protein 4 [Wickerhamomyces ciferrii]CCH45618.1 Something about silencing protein 4 [Wickerhamomyces ciferrii]